MALKVYDYRTDVRNIVACPEIRGRFLRMEPGAVATRHSHDLGHEMFLVLDGQCEFEIEGERAVLGPGQACFARRDEMHQVRTIGDKPITMYLSVTPHFEPTHTMWTADPHESGEKVRPRYGTWRGASDDIPEPTASIQELIARHRAAANALAEEALRSVRAQDEHLAALEQAATAGSKEDARAQVDALWRELYPLLRAVSTLSEAWNDLAPVAAPKSSG